MSIWDRLKSYASQGPQGISRPLNKLPRAEFESQVDGELDKRLIAAGFTRIGKRRWGKEWAPEINALVELEPLSVAFTAAWGVSLPFIPHLAGNHKIGWHKTLRAAQFDLSFHPRDYEKERSAWVVDQFSTKEELATEAPEFASQVVSNTLAFLAPLSQVEKLPAAFEAKRDRPFVQFGLKNYPQELLAYAFVLARCGREGEAEERLKAFWARIREFDDAHKMPKETEEEINRLFVKTLP